MTSSALSGIVGTVPVQERHRFDVVALERYMVRHVESFRGPLAVSQFQGGQSNPTYYLASADADYVLRRKPPGKLLPSAHAIDREYRVISALVGTDVPVPRTYALCEDPEVIGTPFYIMQYVRGRVLMDNLLPGEAPAERAGIYGSMIDVLARIHTVDWRAVGLADFGRPGNYFTRQIHRWSTQYRASETEKIEAMEHLMVWLPEHVPSGDETTLVHGDYRLGNLLIHPTEPRVVGVLDWELSTVGHPLADLAYNCMPYHLGPELYEGFSGKVLGGIPPETEYLEDYCRRTGRAGIPDWEFYVAFAMFRLAAISQGIMGRVLAGTASDPNARDRGVRARALAECAWAIVEHGAGGAS